MRSVARPCIAAMLAGLLAFPGFAANEKPLGFVIQAQSAQISDAKVAIGTTVYPGDKVQTDAGGALRLRMGTTQLYLLASSSATLGQRSDALFAEVSRGTVGFSSMARINWNSKYLKASFERQMASPPTARSP